MIGKLNHVAFAVPDLNAAAAVYRDTLGARVSEAEALPEHGVTVVFVDLGNTLVEVNGDTAQLDTDAMIKHRATLEDGADYQLNMSGTRYGERLERRGGNWCITERQVPPVWAPTGVLRVTSRVARRATSLAGCYSSFERTPRRARRWP